MGWRWVSLLCHQPSSSSPTYCFLYHCKSCPQHITSCCLYHFVYPSLLQKYCSFIPANFQKCILFIYFSSFCSMYCLSLSLALLWLYILFLLLTQENCMYAIITNILSFPSSCSKHLPLDIFNRKSTSLLFGLS